MLPRIPQLCMHQTKAGLRKPSPLCISLPTPSNEVFQQELIMPRKRSCSIFTLADIKFENSLGFFHSVKFIHFTRQRWLISRLLHDEVKKYISGLKQTEIPIDLQLVCFHKCYENLCLNAFAVCLFFHFLHLVDKAHSSPCICLFVS